MNPKKSEKGPWKMFFVGLIYASLSLLLVHWFFKDSLAEASGMIVVVFCIMFSLPYMYFIIKKEEQMDEQVEGLMTVWKIHKDAIYSLMWLFLGFIVAFSFWYIVLQDSNLLNFQVQTFCQINSPNSIDSCISQYSFNNLNGAATSATGAATNSTRFLSIIENNVYVMIFTLLFSLIFGAGAIFVLVWNASVISAAVGIFTKYQLKELPLGLARYLIHGIPEIGAYFITALAGGIFGVGILRHGWKDKRTLRVIENAIILLFISILLLVLAGVIEVYITPILFKS